METENTAGTISVKPGTANNDGRKRALFASGSVIGAILASSCCIVPLILFGFGISGAWISNLTALTPYKPLFVFGALLFLAGGFYTAYRKPKAACEQGSYCAKPTSGRVLKAALWTSTLLIAASLAFPYVAPYLLN